MEGDRRKLGGDRPLIVIAAIAGLAVIAVVLVLLVGCGEDGSGSQGGAHVNEDSGMTNEVKPDERTGIGPPPAKETNLKAAARKAGCKLQLEVPDEGHVHFLPGSSEPLYPTSPPSSGGSVQEPFQQADGAYAGEPEQISVVHSLDNGRMAIEYSPGLTEQAQLELKGLYDTMYGATLMFPYEEMAYDVAAVTWTNLLTCRTYKGQATLDAIRAFGKETWGKYGAKPVTSFKFTGPTPAEPDEPSN